LQNGGLGLASYHFQPGIGEAYISYEAAPQEWNLDDGSRLPNKKVFVDPQYDSDTRTFMGTIEWGETAPFDGEARWEYKMVFSEDFKTIASGEVRGFEATTGCAKSTTVFGRNLFYDLYIEEESQLAHLMGFPEGAR
jgi:hypothetical protein